MVPLSTTLPTDRATVDALTRERERLRGRYELREGLRRFTSLNRLRACASVPVAAVLPVLYGTGPIAQIGGLATCASIHACPVCSARIRAARSIALAAGLDRVLSSGHGVVMLTLTTSHARGESLATVYDAVLSGWKAVQDDKTYRAVLSRFGFVGLVRSVEVTFGWANGWHPHIHVLLVTGAPLGADEMSLLERVVFRSWHRAMLRQGRVAPSREHGVSLVAGSAGAAEYIAKLQEGDGLGAALELLRSDMKSGRRRTFTQFEIAGQLVGGDVRFLPVWNEFETATKGRRAIFMSKGLRSLLELEDEPSDEELAEAGDGELVAFLFRPLWSAARRSGRKGWEFEFRAALRAGQVETWRYLAGLGIDPSVLANGMEWMQ